MTLGRPNTSLGPPPLRYGDLRPWKSTRIFDGRRGAGPNLRKTCYRGEVEERRRSLQRTQDLRQLDAVGPAWQGAYVKSIERTAAPQSLVSRIGVPVEQRRVDAGSIMTHCLVAGSGEPVVLLHGAGKGAIQWYPVIGPVSAHFRVIAPDIVGYGESDKPSAPYDRRFFSGWLRDLLNALRLGQVSLVGTSQGGAVALQFALDRPEQVNRLVLVNSAGLGEIRQRVPASLKLRMVWQELFPSQALGDWILRNYALFNAGKIDTAILELEAYGREVARMPGGRRAFWQGRGRAVAAIPQEQLMQVCHRTLLIWGREDRSFPLSVAQHAARVMPNAQLQIISEAGHVCFLEQPAEFNRMLLQFLVEE